MKNDEDTLWSCVGVVLFALLMIVLNAITSGWALTKLWTWFMVPVFAVPILTIPQAIGIALVIGFLSRHNRESKQKDREFTELAALALTEAVAVPGVTVFIGWIVHSFI